MKTAEDALFRNAVSWLAQRELINTGFTQEGLDRIKRIIDSRLIRIPPDAKVGFPPVLSAPYVSYMAFSGPLYFMLAIFDDEEKVRITGLTRRGYHPFPGLIEEGGSSPSAFNLRNSRNVLLQDTEVKNLICISLGLDSTIAIVNHRQTLITKELGTYSYVVQLAYILSYGEEIARENLHDHLENLIAYTINVWDTRGRSVSKA